MGVAEYRQIIDIVVQPGDAILEVGCHMGTSTSLLSERAEVSTEGSFIGIDIESSIIQEATKRYADLFFEVGDAWDASNLLRIQKGYTKSHYDKNSRCGFDVVYIDLGGLSGKDGILGLHMLLSSLEHALEPRCLVIKSKCMRQLSSTLSSFWHYQQGKNIRTDIINSGSNSY